MDIAGNKPHYALNSLFGRIQLNYDQKYYLSASLRRDGSSKFTKANRYDIFPAISEAWTISIGDVQLNRIVHLAYPILSILREEIKGYPFKHDRGDLHVSVINSEGDSLLSIPVGRFRTKANALLIK